MTMTIIDEDGKPREVPIRVGLQLNDEADARDEAARQWEKHVEEQRENPYLDRLDRIHGFILCAHEDMRTILKENNLNDKETRKIFSIAEDLQKFQENLRELSFNHALKEGF